MSTLEKLNKYIKEKHPTADPYYVKLILETICEGGIKTIFVEGALYEVHADRLETKE